MGKLDEGGSKAQTLGYSEHCWMAYVKVLKRLNPKSFHHKESIFVTIGGDGF